MAAAVCYSLSRMPLQVTDGLVPMLDAQNTPSVGAAIRQSASATAYLRPLRAAQIQALFELSNGRYFLAYRGFHAALVVWVLALFVLVLDVGTLHRLSGFLFGLTVATGLHTFRGMVWEAYPVNHTIEVAGWCLLALVLARAPHRFWSDLAAALTLLVAAFTVESGVLVWVVVVAAWLTGARGVSWRGVALATVVLAGYLVARFALLDTGSPGLSERASGFGLQQLGPDELMRRFGARPYIFYAYNVVSSLLTVLFSEPRSGIWTVPAELLQGRVAAGTALNVVSSGFTTALIGWFVLTRLPAWAHRQFDGDDQVVLVGLALVAANAVVGYGYTKDEIMGPAGVFYALAACVAATALIERIGRLGLGSTQRVLAIVGAVVLMSSIWALRAAGLHYQMHVMAFANRNEWVYVDQWLERQGAAPKTEAGRALVRGLREDALERFTVNPYLLSPRLEQWFR
jgi:hypothetical protein